MKKITSKKVFFGEDPILHTAWLYYHDELNQSDIAAILGVSRATVIKYLQQARERGYVQITLDQQRYTHTRLALALQQRFLLQNVLILPRKNEPETLIERLHIAGARYLQQTINDGDILGVTCDSTLFQMIPYIHPRQCRDVTVVQMIGSMCSPLAKFTAEECSTQLAGKFSGRAINLHVPAVVSSARLATELRTEQIIKQQFTLLNRCNKAILNIGLCNADHQMVRSGLLTPDELADYQQRGSIGILCGRFCDRYGQAVVSQLDQRILGITLAELRQIPERILIGGGKEFCPVIHAALLGKYVTDLITDEETAETLLAYPTND